MMMTTSRDGSSLLPVPMPISMMIWGGPGTEPDTIKVASAYEAATHYRVPLPILDQLENNSAFA